MPSTEHGRRAADYWGRVGKLLTVIVSATILLTAVGKTWTAGAQIAETKIGLSAVEIRVKRIETLQADGHYMTCVLFQEVHPNEVLASCDLALRRPHK